MIHTNHHKKIASVLLSLFSLVLMLQGCTPSMYKKGVDYDNFPEKYIPIYDDSIVYSFSEKSDEYEISFGSNDRLSSIIKYYQSEFQNTSYIIIDEHEEKNEYEANGYIDDCYFELSIQDASGEEAKYFDNTIDISIEIVGIENVPVPQITDTSNDTIIVGILMPTDAYQRWRDDGKALKNQLEAKGYEAFLEYADNDIDNQIEQIEDMITLEADILVIAPVHGGALDSALTEAKNAGMTIIAYDRLLMYTSAVDYYVTFDNTMVGEMQGKYIVEALGLDKGETGPFNIEIFCGAPDDYNSYYYNLGAMSVLEPYIKKNILNVVSGQGETNSKWEDASIAGWSSQVAYERMAELLEENYGNSTIHAILSPNDSIAQGVTYALEQAGYGTEEKPFPILTGQDCDIYSIRNIIDGKQSMSAFKDTMDLVSRTVLMINQIIAAGEVETNNSYNNESIIVPSYLCSPKCVDIYSYEEILFESGYYSYDLLD